MSELKNLGFLWAMEQSKVSPLFDFHKELNAGLLPTYVWTQNIGDVFNFDTFQLRDVLMLEDYFADPIMNLATEYYQTTTNPQDLISLDLFKDGVATVIDMLLMTNLRLLVKEMTISISKEHAKSAGVDVDGLLEYVNKESKLLGEGDIPFTAVVLSDQHYFEDTFDTVLRERFGVSFNINYDDTIYLDKLNDSKDHVIMLRFSHGQWKWGSVWTDM